MRSPNTARAASALARGSSREVCHAGQPDDLLNTNSQAKAQVPQVRCTQGTTRGLGKLQRRIKEMLGAAMDAEIGCLTWPHIRQVVVLDYGGKPGESLNPTFERSLKRGLKTLVERGDVLVVGGRGGPGDPYRYTTVEAFASVAEDRKVTDAGEAKAIVATLAEAILRGAP